MKFHVFFIEITEDILFRIVTFYENPIFVTFHFSVCFFDKNVFILLCTHKLFIKRW